jgi:hypothetical protein
MMKFAILGGLASPSLSWSNRQFLSLKSRGVTNQAAFFRMLKDPPRI